MNFFLLGIFLYFPIFYKSNSFISRKTINTVWGWWRGGLTRADPETKPGHTYMHWKPPHTAPGSLIIFFWDWSFHQLQTSLLKHITIVISPSHPRVDQRSLADSLPKSIHILPTIFPWSTSPDSSPIHQGNLASLTWLVWPWWANTGSCAHQFFSWVFAKQLLII